MVGPGRAGLGR
ncbi:unnamed protein product, partial [Rotaria sp. Silwood2]